MRSGGGGPLTVKDMREAIAGLADDVEFMFGSTIAGDELVFYRFKWRDQKQKLLQIELNELSPEEARSLQRDDECMAALEALLQSKSELTPASVDDIFEPWLAGAGRQKAERRQLLAKEFRARTGPSARREFIYSRLMGRIP